MDLTMFYRQPIVFQVVMKYLDKTISNLKLFYSLVFNKKNNNFINNLLNYTTSANKTYKFVLLKSQEALSIAT